MEVRINITGVSPIIMHNGWAGLAPRSPANLEKKDLTRKRGTNRTEADETRIAELDCFTSLWLDDEGRPEVPVRALRACIEKGARKVKQGPLVRESFMLLKTEGFTYDTEKYPDPLERSTQYTVPVVVGGSRISRTRAKFDEWSFTAFADIVEEQIDLDFLDHWLSIAGARIGLGDWRPEKSGGSGRFTHTLAFRSDDGTWVDYPAE